MIQDDLPVTDEGDAKRSHLDFWVVGIGASAGGIPALTSFFEHLPDHSGMAFVVILHLAADHESHLDEILQRSTSMPVKRVVETMAIKPEHVYVISPALQLEMIGGHLRVKELRHVRGRPTAIDDFFRTLAEAHRERAVSVILSGSGADGAVGIARVKEFGGVTFVQSPDDAEQDGMPRAAIATRAIDFVMSVDEMPRRIAILAAQAKKIRLPHDPGIEAPAKAIEDDEEIRRADEALRDIMSLLRARTRHDFQHYKRGTILRRLERRLQVHGLVDLPSYRDYLRDHSEETNALLQDLLISVTNFFRDASAFDALAAQALPSLLAKRGPDDPIRIWIAGCATGEEAYSVAMLVFEQIDHLPTVPEVQIFATDIDERAIAVGRAGIYPAAIAADVTPERLRRFFTREHQQYRIVKSVRESVLFAVHNVLRDPPFSRLDLICCRNLLIYLDRGVQADVLETFRFALGGGLLFLGSSESTDAAPAAFAAVDKKHRIYRANPDGRPRFATLDASESGDIGLQRTATQVQRQRRFSYAQRHQEANDRHAAPSILIDQDQNILHVSDNATRFLTHSAGVPSNQLLANVDPVLGLELRTALFKVSETGRSVEARPVRFEHDGVQTLVNVTILPVDGDDPDRRDLLVRFVEVADTLRSAEPRSEEGDNAITQQLEGEVKRLKGYLQDTIEDSETSTEELKASNEELQAINEELRSTTEELETSKEELQSMNEELTTVNFELKVKFDETAKINDDLRNLIASTDIATIFVDNALRIKRFTPRAVDMFSLIPSDVGRPLLDINHRLDYDALANDVALAFDTLKTTERRVTSSDGRHYLARVLPYRTNDDKIEGAVITFVNVTALHYAEERARSGEESLRLVAETTKDFAILTTDESGVISTWNAGAERVFGYSELEAIGESIALIFTQEDRAAGVPMKELHAARSAGRAEDERWHLRKDGTRIYCSGVLTPFASDSLSGFAKIARDVTEAKEEQAGRDALLAREQVARARSEAAAAMKDELLAVMSHELKHPLNLILVNAELLTRLPAAVGEPSITRAAETIRKAVIGQGKIIDDLLDLSRARTGKLTLEITEVNLAAVVETIVTSLAQDAKARDITLSFTTDASARPVRADGVRVEQIVWNVLSNALKFTPDGGRIEVTLDTDGDDARLTVSDTGKGIEASFMPRIFDMFTQETHGPSREQGGLGIGLALAWELVTAQAGRIEALSDGPGHGATFRVWLPLFRDTRLVRRSAKPRVRDLDGLRVLVVDDSRESVEPFVKLLKLEGADASGSVRARDALALLESETFDVVVSDLAMPDMDGFTLVREIRARPSIAGVIAIAVSGYGRDKDRADAIEAGYDAHLGKPTSVEDLQKAVRSVRRRRG